MFTQIKYCYSVGSCRATSPMSSSLLRLQVGAEDNEVYCNDSFEQAEEGDSQLNKKFVSKPKAVESQGF